MSSGKNVFKKAQEWSSVVVSFHIQVFSHAEKKLDFVNTAARRTAVPGPPRRNFIFDVGRSFDPCRHFKVLVSLWTPVHISVIILFTFTLAWQIFRSLYSTYFKVQVLFCHFEHPGIFPSIFCSLESCSSIARILNISLNMPFCLDISKSSLLVETLLRKWNISPQLQQYTFCTTNEQRRCLGVWAHITVLAHHLCYDQSSQLIFNSDFMIWQQEWPEMHASKQFWHRGRNASKLYRRTQRFWPMQLDVDVTNVNIALHLIMIM